jgi:hypothetical protein
MQIGQIIEPRRSMPDFFVPAVVCAKRMGRWGSEYAVVNGSPRNRSVRWYNWRDVRPAGQIAAGTFTPVEF